MLRTASVAVLASAILFAIQGQVVPPGGHHPLSPDDPMLQPAVDYAAANINAEARSKFCQTLVNIENATEQVVDGALYEITLSMQESEECTNEECMATRVTPDQCPPSTKSKPYRCDVAVVIKSWSEPTHFVRNLTCDYPPK